mmetsp:Transcript_72851/g.122085  ORF Transcript_72851/g.122085 Transcript_72851/m.122085 type:complete len:204 (-) Transcript_72851:726-1337(-)
MQSPYRCCVGGRCTGPVTLHCAVQKPCLLGSVPQILSTGAWQSVRDTGFLRNPFNVQVKVWFVGKESILQSLGPFTSGFRMLPAPGFLRLGPWEVTARLAEHMTREPEVPGSTPGSSTNNKAPSLSLGCPRATWKGIEGNTLLAPGDRPGDLTPPQHTSPWAPRRRPYYPLLLRCRGWRTHQPGPHARPVPRHRRHQTEGAWQ